MKTTPKRSTVYFDPDLYKALKIKAAQYEKSLSELINQAVRWSLVEDAEELGSALIVLPKTLDEQRQIAVYIQAESEQIENLKVNHQIQIATLEQYRKSLIHECVMGKRRIE